MEGVILAAGLSSRFPEYKMTQKINGKYLIELCVNNMLPHVDHIYLVTGHNNSLIEDIFKNSTKVTCIYNEAYLSGMYSSIKAGVAKTTKDFFLMPGDMVCVKAGVFSKLRDQEGLVVIPSYDYKAGHPIKIAASLKNQIIGSEHKHLRAFLNDYEKTYINVSCPSILYDVDNKEDLEMIRGLCYENH